MADRYWVGGTNTWNTTNTNRWSATSGGASGASVPTAADSVFFDQAGTYTVTMTGALECLDLTVSTGSVTFATGTAPTLNIYGSMTLLSGTAWNSTGAITFSATSGTHTITGAASGFRIAATSVQIGPTGSSTATWTLGTRGFYVATTSAISVASGTFNTGGFIVDGGSFSSSGTSVRAINLGASEITVRGSGNSVDFTTTTNLTFNAGTSSISLGASGATFIGGGLTFYRLNIGGLATASQTYAITGANTFDRIFFSAVNLAVPGTITCTINAAQTIGTLDTNSTAGNRRIFISSATYGIAQTLTINSTVAISDCDFRGIYVTGTSAPISGTRIGNRGECRNITFDAPKTVYWNLAGAQNWSATAWATVSGGGTATNNFPLPQDTATFTNAGSVTGTITLDTAIGYVPNVDMSGRTTAMTLGLSNATTVYGNWTNGSGTAFTGSSTLTFSGGNTQTITSAAKTFPGGITIDTYGGTVQLDSQLNIGGATLTVTNGTFTTNGYTVTAGAISSSNSNVRTINLGASSVALSLANGLLFSTATNLTFNAGSSQITISVNTTGTSIVNFGGLTYNNVTFTNAAAGVFGFTISGQNTFANLTLAATNVSANIQIFNFAANQTITGTLTCAGASAVQRLFLRSDTTGTQRTLTVNSLSATDCDFRDISLTGVASGATPTRAGDCGGNSGINFSTKTVYWNLAGAQNWSATGWATSSGGSPAVNNFPLAQDTAVFDDTGSVTGTITVNAQWNTGTFDASLRTSAMTLTTSTNTFVVYGDWKFGTGVTLSSTTGTITFSKNGTQTVTSNAVQFGTPVTINHPTGTVQLADALSLGATRALTVTTGTFDAVTYNVTAGLFTLSGTATRTIRMGSGTWTATGTGSVWNVQNNTGLTLVAGTSNIVLSDTSASARTFDGGTAYYNKLTIGGTTGTSTLTIAGSNTFGELASTKTVAHTIAIGTGVQTFGKWSVTGTAGNVVTVTGTSTTNVIAGPRVSGVDYLAMGTLGFSTTSPGEFYAGANSTGTGAGVILTAAPTPRTLYWRGGTGNWSDTTKWDTVSGGTGPAAIPTSADAVNFNSLSNATAYTITIDAGVTIARCAAFSMAGPAVGNVTFAGSVPIAFHGNVLFAATGITRTYTGTMNWAGDSSYTFNTNGLALGSNCTINGVGSTWALGFNTDISISTFTVTYGTFSTSASNYNLTAGQLSSNNSNVRTISLNGSTLTLSSSVPIAFTTATNLTFNSGSSTITMNASAPGFDGGGQTFYNVTFNQPSGSNAAITGANTFNNLTFSGRTTVGINASTFAANQTISGTLTVSAGTASAYRTFLASNTIGTTRTLSCAAVSATDADFRDITIAGAAAPASGTRLGDAKGNSGITFPAAKTVYWAVAGGGNWGATGNGSWTDSSGNPAVITAFPLPQDTAYIPFATPNDNTTITVNANYNIGTIDMNQRNGSARVTLATGATSPTICGNWINGTGTTLSGTATLTFSGRGSQQLTSAGRTFSQSILVDSPSGSVTLQDAFTGTSTTLYLIRLSAGTFDANNFNVTGPASINFGVLVSGTLSKTLAIGSGTWTIGAGGSTSWNNTGSSLTVTGTGTISMTSASAKTFVGGGISYSGITVNQGGAGALTITGDNTFKTITNTYSATGATSISLGNTTQTLTNPWTATGAATRVLTISGTSAASPGTLVYSGVGTAANVDYLTINNVRAYPLATSWYAGANSTNGGSLGWYFVSAGGTVYAATITETGTGTDTVVASLRYLGTIDELATGTDTVNAGLLYSGVISETGAGSDTISAQSALGVAILESAIIADTNLARLIARATISETATGTDIVSARATFFAAVAESATITDLITSLKGYFVAIVESASASDTVSARYIARPSISETAAATDIVRAYFTAAARVNELATGTDQISALRRLAAAVVEAATATDSVFSRLPIFALIQEAAAAQDAVNAAGSIYRVLMQELATAQDAITARATFRSSLTETATGTQTNSAAFIPLARITETTTITDAASAVQAFAAQIAEASAASDVVLVAPSIFNAIALASATALDNFNPAGSIYRVTVPESATLSDSVIGAFLWNLIDDSQSVNWQNVVAAQSVSWSSIDSNQTPGWSNVDNSQSTSWGNIQDDQDPDWTDVPTLK
jgi:hypothetical protein